MGALGGPLVYLLAGIAFVATLGGVYLKIHHDGYTQGSAEVKNEWNTANEQARKVAVAQDARNLARKEKADADAAKTRRDLAGLYDAYASLRDQRRLGSLLPEAAPGSPSPDRITFNRKGFDSALSGFDQGVTGLLKEGDGAITDLNAAKKWAQERGP